MKVIKNPNELERFLDLLKTELYNEFNTRFRGDIRDVSLVMIDRSFLRALENFDDSNNLKESSNMSGFKDFVPSGEKTGPAGSGFRDFVPEPKENPVEKVEEVEEVEEVKPAPELSDDDLVDLGIDKKKLEELEKEKEKEEKKKPKAKK